MERALYLLPLRKDDDEDYAGDDLDEMGLTEKEVLYMVEKETLELPRNFLRREVTKSSQFTTLRFVGFDVRDKWPNNIVRLRNGRIMYVTHFEKDVDNDKTVHIVHGHCFEQVQYS
jgi:hypothetical protein